MFGGRVLGVKLSELQEKVEIKLIITAEGSKANMEMKGVIKSIIRDNMAIIDIDYASEKKLKFDNVRVDLECDNEDDVPILWRDVKIVYYKSEYLLQTPTEGKRHNRRNCFRVGVSKKAVMTLERNGNRTVMVRDISLSGFSITDRNKELNLSVGSKVRVKFEDIGHILDLTGVVVRIEEHEDMIIYGMEITNICKDLSSYISVKQRRNRM